MSDVARRASAIVDMRDGARRLLALDEGVLLKRFTAARLERVAADLLQFVADAEGAS